MSVVSYSESGFDTQDERWDDWEDDELLTPMKCLFCATTFQSAITLFRHVKQHHGFDFPHARKTLNLDFYQSMRAVNYIRTLEKTDPKFSQVSQFELTGTEAFLNDDEYLKPVLEDDTLLYALDELDLDDTRSIGGGSRAGSLARSPMVGEGCVLRERELASKVKALEQQLGIKEREVTFVTEQFDEYRQMVKRQFYDNMGDKTNDDGGKEKEGGDYYFNSYANNDIHLQMLQDKVRTEGYRDFMYDSKSLFHGKVVLDVGCGTGILSMFAARAGASKVIAVDNSDIVVKARANVAENGLDNVITVVRGKIEDIELPVDSVDIIISEWMGYFLLFEAMLDSVLVARDRFLAPGGLLAPSASYIYLTAIQDDEYMHDQVNYWDNVYGFKMSAMKKLQVAAKEADVDVIPNDAVVATRSLIAEIDHGTTTSKKLDFASSFSVTVTRDSTVHALLGYFDVAFSQSQAVPGPSSADLTADAYEKNGQVTDKALWKQSMHGFTTGPHGTPTHWKQTVFVLPESIVAKEGDEVRGDFVCRKSATNPRELDIEVAYYHVPKGMAEGEFEKVIKHQSYQLV
ncbi:hypothetical protein FBU59_004357 [Linderina macrospora]|uniref:Uncharacterized protein n=1 Tax=Linderina macrospora TaxID=4868 RepID=A0ACC1J5L6_9FUNG|nr:hypothetical protein FBU59_004357 [Linderina macrospora]